MNRGHPPHQAAEIVLVPGLQFLCHARPAFPGERNAPDPFGSDPADPLSQPLGNFPVRVPEEAVVGEEIGVRTARKHLRIGREKRVAGFLGKGGIRGQGDKGEFQADRPDVNTDVHQVPP